MSYAIRCPGCISHERLYQAPLGKIVRNQSASHPYVFDKCRACAGTGYVPGVVVDAIKQSFPKNSDDILASLRWNGDHFSFSRWGMYVGVEIDGYIHT